ncbi:MAG: hypothetical protein AAGB34_10740, partial [Planctomycetota bacterium]
MVAKLIMCGVIVACAGGVAAESSSFAVTSASAAGDLGNAGNTVIGGSFTGTHTVRSLTWRGDLTSSPFAFFFEEDVHASISGPNGIGYTGPVAGEQGIFLGTTPFSGWYAGFAPAPVTGDWRFEAYTPGTLAGATNWSIVNTEFSFNSDLFPEAQTIGVGTDLTAEILEAEILWYSIDHAGGALEISTEGSTIFELEGNIQVDDTLIALYAPDGTLVGSDDNSGEGLTSLLSIADLSAGEYRLAVTGATLGTRVGDAFIATSHDGEGSIRLSVNIP